MTLALKKQTKATVFDVAELAGVSIKTVSRVVNREPHVGATTQKRVAKAIATLNYFPSEVARKLAGCRRQKVV
jgi:LacI family transcriptional regulator